MVDYGGKMPELKDQLCALLRHCQKVSPRRALFFAKLHSLCVSHANQIVYMPFFQFITLDWSKNVNVILVPQILVVGFHE